jgi:hypothetical protein
LQNRHKTGYLQRVLKAEDVIIEKAKNLRDNQSDQAILDYYQWLDTYIVEFYDPILPCEPLKYDLPHCEGSKVCR